MVWFLSPRVAVVMLSSDNVTEVGVMIGTMARTVASMAVVTVIAPGKVRAPAEVVEDGRAVVTKTGAGELDPPPVTVTPGMVAETATGPGETLDPLDGDPATTVETSTGPGEVDAAPVAEPST